MCSTQCGLISGVAGRADWTGRGSAPCAWLQVPALNIFETSFRRGKFDESRKLSNGQLMDFKHIYPMDAVFDTPADVPEDVSPCLHAMHGDECVCVPCSGVPRHLPPAAAACQSPHGAAHAAHRRQACTAAQHKAGSGLE